VSEQDFRDALLASMERKVHWAWPSFTSGRVPADRLHVHLEHEWETFVRDFPVLLGRAYVQCPIPEVRRDLAENLYEEETGGIAAGRPHPELFLEIPAGLGMDLTRFPWRPDRSRLLPAGRRYREVVDDCTTRRGWAVAVAVTTLFLEGTAHDRALFDPSAPAREEPPLTEHPLVLHYGLAVERLALVRAHRGVEGEHRLAAWRMVLGHVPASDRPGVVQAMDESLGAWLAYRDAVAEACGLSRS
jgi:pyrroloquinoline quinone (PQQ) biosynthesis protein C